MKLRNQDQNTVCRHVMFGRGRQDELWGVVRTELELVLERCLDSAGCSNGEGHFRRRTDGVKSDRGTAGLMCKREQKREWRSQS